MKLYNKNFRSRKSLERRNCLYTENQLTSLLLIYKPIIYKLRTNYRKNNYQLVDLKCTDNREKIKIVDRQGEETIGFSNFLQRRQRFLCRLACRQQLTVNRPPVEVSKRAISRNSMERFRGRCAATRTVDRVNDRFVFRGALSFRNNGKHASLEFWMISMGPSDRLDSNRSVSHNCGWLFLFSPKQTSSFLLRKGRKGDETRKKRETPLLRSNGFYISPIFSLWPVKRDPSTLDHA